MNDIPSRIMEYGDLSGFDGICRDAFLNPGLAPFNKSNH